MDQSRLEEADRLQYSGDYDAAIAIYSQLIDEFATDPDVYLAWHGRGRSYCFNGYFDESIADLEKTRDLSAAYVKGGEDLFKTYLMLGMNDEAKVEMRRVLKLDPGQAHIRRGEPGHQQLQEGCGEVVAAALGRGVQRVAERHLGIGATFDSRQGRDGDLAGAQAQGKSGK